MSIALERGLDSVVLRVVDDGHGFDTARPDEHGGLRSMRERALLDRRRARRSRRLRPGESRCASRSRWLLSREPLEVQS